MNDNINRNTHTHTQLTHLNSIQPMFIFIPVRFETQPSFSFANQVENLIFTCKERKKNPELDTLP